MPNTAWIRPYFWWLRKWRAMSRVAEGRTDVKTYRRLANPLRKSSNGGPVPVRMRALDGASVLLRPGTTDAGVAWAALVGEYHLPPRGIQERHLADPHVIWDLGANIGLTMAQMAQRFPKAHITGVELEPENAALARRNTEPWSDRCAILLGAVWPTPGEVRFSAAPGAEDRGHVDTAGAQTAVAVSLNAVLDQTGPPDFVKMDIEGAEAAVLTTASDWAQHTGAIAVECHPPYSLDQCSADLRALGFEVHLAPRTLRRRARDLAIGVRS